MSIHTYSKSVTGHKNTSRYSSDFGNGSTQDITTSDAFTEELVYGINVYVALALVTLGTIGNLLSVTVFFKSKLRGQSTSQYLSALAISDTIFLLQLIPPWLKDVGLSQIFAWQGFCQLFVYFTYVSSSCSSWLVVSFTTERLVVIQWPLRRTHMCTVRRARLVILGITLACFAINIPVLIFAVPQGKECNFDHELMGGAEIFNVIDTVFSFTLPLTIITVINVLIVCHLSRTRGQLIREEEINPRGRIPGRQPYRRHLAGPSTRSLLRRSQQRITRMLLIVSSVFVLLNLPAYTMRIIAYASNMSGNEYIGRWAALQQICLLFFNSNFSINFFLYCMTGQKFREALCQTFPWLEHFWNGLKRCLCCWTMEQVPPPRPSVTNSISVNTEASANKAGYFKSRRFDNSRQQERQHQVQFELQEYPTRLFKPERPVPRWPIGAVSPESPGSAHTSTSLRAITNPTFQPIPYDLVPGQIAPFNLTPRHLAGGYQSPLSAYAYVSPDSPVEFEEFRPDYESAGEYNHLRQPQPPRTFSIPARHNNEEGHTTPEWNAVQPRPWSPASGASSPASYDSHAFSRSRMHNLSISNRLQHATDFQDDPESMPVDT